MQINTKTNRSNLYHELQKQAIIRKIKPLLGKEGGYMMRPEDGKFVPIKPQIDFNTPWVHVQPQTTANCILYHRVFFDVLGHIHSYCRSCWKVVVRPRTLEQLFDLYEIQKEMGVPAKCGMETRAFVEGLYGGYFYTRSQEKGLERWNQVREVVSERLGPNIPVILKRYCTEFEISGNAKRNGYGKSNETPDVTREEREWEFFVESLFGEVVENHSQHRHLTAEVMLRWIEYASEHGDQTYRLFTGGKKLVPDYVTYHPEEQHARFSNERRVQPVPEKINPTSGKELYQALDGYRKLYGNEGCNSSHKADDSPSV